MTPQRHGYPHVRNPVPWFRPLDYVSSCTISVPLHSQTVATNVMRHSFGSYALSAWQDVGKVSYQMGNSPQICKRHYEQIVTKSAAESFWALRPAADAAGKIVPMKPPRTYRDHSE